MHYDHMIVMGYELDGQGSITGRDFSLFHNVWGPVSLPYNWYRGLFARG
jgi:hypothetical protein